MGLRKDMVWRFGEYTLDPARAELASAEGPIHVERNTLDVLIHLVQNAERVVTRDELLDAVWDGRIVSDATISTAIKHARKAIGDSGAAQTYIRTIHGRGFRFVGDVTIPAPAPASAFQPEAEATVAAPLDQRPGAGQPSLAVLRFQSLDGSGQSRQIADAFPAEMISNLSRIGWLHMIARGSSFQFDPETVHLSDVFTQLKVRYIATGTVEVTGDDLAISIETLSAPDGALVWTERFTCALHDISIRRAEIVSSIISALELAIPEREARMSRRLAVHEFDAWSHYHLGLTHLFRFNPGDNLIARQHFETASSFDPEFARAHAGLSFVHWQTAFMQFGDDRKAMLKEAVAAANRALEIDRTEPFAAFNIGRAHWLEGDIEAGLAWLDRSLQVNPNSAQSHYCSGLLQVLAGSTDQGRSRSEKALALSPLDPMSYAMHATRSMSALLDEDFETARRLSDQAVNTPRAHFYITLIAALASELSGARRAAERYRDLALAQRSDASAELFFSAFPFQRTSDRDKLNGAFRRLGMA